MLITKYSPIIDLVSF